MAQFRATLVPGGKTPYNSWRFVVVPEAVANSWGRARVEVRGSLNGHPFAGRAARGEGVMRIPVPMATRAAAGIKDGVDVEVVLEPSLHPPAESMPDEIRQQFEQTPGLEALFRALPPSYRRAWTDYVADARRADTRAARATRAVTGIRERQYPR